ncbi:MAG: hypothetical protein ACR2J8_03880 [Thermomicrobiales bacterium]
MDALDGASSTRRGLIRAVVGGAIAAAGITRMADPEAAYAANAADDCDPNDPDCTTWYGAGRPQGRTGCILLPASQRGSADGRYTAKAFDIPAPVLVGMPWYETFDRPVKKGAAWWIGTGSAWGEVRAGHAVCLRPPSMPDPVNAWQFDDQGATDACVGFATSRMCSLFNAGRFYNGVEMYKAAQRYDRWAGTNYVGTSIDGGLEAALQVGPYRFANEKTTGPFKSDGVKSWTWVETADDVLAALGSSEGFVRLLNSWGIGYPKEVRLPLSALTRLIRENAQFATAVDRPTGDL